MKRFHVHVGVQDIKQSIAFYTGLFGAPPTVKKSDYAKWMVEDPRLNFAISQRDGRIGVNHLGLQADNADELGGIREHFAAADAATVIDEPGAKCCYAISDKHWVTDPQGIAWEGYHSLGEVRYFDGDEIGSAAAACGASDKSQGVSEGNAKAPRSCCAPATGTVARHDR